MIEGHGDDIYRYGAIRCNFSSNISPFIDTSELRKHLAGRLEVINHYPEPSAHALELLLAKVYDISPDEVLVTSGATDAIYLIAQTLREEGTFAVKRPTFSEYADACRMFGYQEAPKGGAVRWLCNPNNPTGELRTIDTIKVLSRRHHWLIIDQSYENYLWRKTLSPHDAREMQNVIQIHSMTKRFAIPGLRLGFITAPASIIKRLRANHRPWAVNALAIEAGQWLITHQDPNEQYLIEELLSESRILANRLRRIFGIHVYPSMTNFMLCSIRQGSAAELKEYLLKNHQFLIRDASNFEGLKDDIIDMLAGGRSNVDTTGFQNDLSVVHSKDDVLTILIHLGYLSYDRNEGKCFIPNKEVAGEMEKAVERTNWTNLIIAIKKSEALLQATLAGDADAVASGLDVAHDENTSILSYNDENSLACVLGLAYYYAKNDYVMHREYASGKGYADLVLIPRKNVSSPALVIELKYNKDAQAAITQIKNRNYPQKVAEYTGEILLVGINYDRGTKRHDCQIERWVINS